MHPHGHIAAHGCRYYVDSKQASGAGGQDAGGPSSSSAPAKRALDPDELLKQAEEDANVDEVRTGPASRTCCRMHHHVAAWAYHLLNNCDCMQAFAWPSGLCWLVVVVMSAPCKPV